jgi:hypothetical protein
MIFLQILNDTGMCKAGLPHDGLRSLCPNVVDLDISNNYLFFSLDIPVCSLVPVKSLVPYKLPLKSNDCSLLQLTLLLSNGFLATLTYLRHGSWDKMFNTVVGFTIR